MKISAINNYANYTHQNAGQKVSFGIFGTEEDARIAKKGGKPKHKREVEEFMRKKIQPFVDVGVGLDFESKPGKPISAFEMLARSPHFVFYQRKKDNTIGVAPIEQSFIMEDEKVRYELSLRKRRQDTIITRLPDINEDEEAGGNAYGRNIFGNMLFWIFNIEYKKNFPPSPEEAYEGYNTDIREGLQKIDQILKGMKLDNGRAE